MTRRNSTNRAGDGRLPDSKTTERVTNALMRLNEACGHTWTGEMELTGLKLKLGFVDHFDTMVIVTAQDDDGKPWVAFHSANLPSEALVGAINRFMNGQLKWREDEYQARGSGKAD